MQSFSPFLAVIKRCRSQPRWSPKWKFDGSAWKRFTSSFQLLKLHVHRFDNKNDHWRTTDQLRHFHYAVEFLRIFAFWFISRTDSSPKRSIKQRSKRVLVNVRGKYDGLPSNLVFLVNVFFFVFINRSNCSRIDFISMRSLLFSSASFSMLVHSWLIRASSNCDLLWRSRSCWRRRSLLFFSLSSWSSILPGVALF